MSFSLYQSSVPVFERSLVAFLGILDKAEAHAQARKFDPTNYLVDPARPRHVSAGPAGPDILRSRQERLVPARGRPPPRIEDNETTFAELRARVGRRSAI